jgi:hypothetical protein
MFPDLTRLYTTSLSREREKIKEEELFLEGDLDPFKPRRLLSDREFPSFTARLLFFLYIET